MPFLCPSENTNETNAFLMILEANFRQNCYFHKKDEIYPNAPNFAQFHQNSLIFMIFTKFWCFGPSEGYHFWCYHVSDIILKQKR